MLVKTKHTFQIIVFTLALLCCGGICLAQSTATLQGTVKDEKGSVVPGAKVTARNRPPELNAPPKAILTATIKSLPCPLAIILLASRPPDSSANSSAI